MRTKSEAMSIVTKTTIDYLKSQKTEVTEVVNFLEEKGLYRLGLQTHFIKGKDDQTVLVFYHDDKTNITASCFILANSPDDDADINVVTDNAKDFVRSYWTRLSDTMSAELILRHIIVMFASLYRDNVEFEWEVLNRTLKVTPEYVNFLKKTMEVDLFRMRLFISLAEEKRISWDTAEELRDSPIEWLMELSK